MKTNQDVIEAFRKSGKTFLEKTGNQAIFMIKPPLSFYVTSCNALNFAWDIARSLLNEPSDEAEQELGSLYDEYFDELREICGMNEGGYND